MNAVLAQVEAEASISIKALTTRSVIANVILRYRDRLLFLITAAWQNAAGDDVEINVPVLNETEEKIAITAKLVGIWRAEARRASDLIYVEASIVQHIDADAHLDPKLIVRDAEIVLLNAIAGWALYDRVKLYGVLAFDNTALDYAVTAVSPNELLDPLFSRCLILRGAKYLAMLAQDYSLAGSLEVERMDVETLLLTQAAANGRSESSRR